MPFLFKDITTTNNIEEVDSIDPAISKRNYLRKSNIFVLEIVYDQYGKETIGSPLLARAAWLTDSPHLYIIPAEKGKGGSDDFFPTPDVLVRISFREYLLNTFVQRLIKQLFSQFFN